MSKFKKITAIAAAAVLSVSMSVGAFASSPTDPDQLTPEEQEIIDDYMWYYDHYLYSTSGEDKDGNKVTAYGKRPESEVIDILQDEEQLEEILTDAGYQVKEDQHAVVIAATDLNLVDWKTFEDMEVPEGGVDLELNLGWSGTDLATEEYYCSNPELEGLKDGDTLYILHQKADGTWEVFETTVKVTTDEYGYTDYTVSAHFDSLSPVAVIKILSDGSTEVQKLDKTGSITYEAKKDSKSGEMKLVKTTAEKKSPKTGN